MRFAIGVLVALAALGGRTACAAAQKPATSPTSEGFIKGCPGAAAFIKREKERERIAPSGSNNSVSQPALRNELKQMVARDQAVRTAFFIDHDSTQRARLVATDATNLSRLKSIVAQFGFPTRKMVGSDGVQAAWLLTQHADTDVAFQTRVLSILKARSESDIRPGDIAMLEDRIRVHEGKPQRYGSNFDLKTLQPTPIDDPEHVDERRAQVHLMPMADYRCVMREMYESRK